MEELYEAMLAENIGRLKCPKNFECCTEGLENLSKAEDVGMPTFIRCLETNSPECRFSAPYGYSNFCSCPLRVYMCKKLKV